MFIIKLNNNKWYAFIETLLRSTGSVGEIISNRYSIVKSSHPRNSIDVGICEDHYSEASSDSTVGAGSDTRNELSSPGKQSRIFYGLKIVEILIRGIEVKVYF